MVAKKFPARFGGRCECGNHAWAVLTSGYITIVSPEDSHEIETHAWFARKDRSTFYAYRTFNGRSVSLHRTIMCFPPCLVDHGNGWGCDNRRSNIRQATFSENGFNRKNSAMVGIRRLKNARKWHVTIGFRGKRLFLGAFETINQAQKARQAAAKKLFGEFASTRDQLIIDEEASA